MYYELDEVDETLSLVPMAARRALDWAGLELSLSGWQSLSLDEKQALAQIGSETTVAIARVKQLASAADPPPESLEASGDPPPSTVPDEVARAFGAERPIADGVWSALSNLDRFVLAKVAHKARPKRLDAAYGEIIGASRDGSHVAPGGGVRMVDVGAKPTTRRTASARSQVRMNAEAYARLLANNPKGDVLGTARLAAIMAAKKTPDWIPLCHPLALTKIDVALAPNDGECAVAIVATVEAFDRTGVEMEALTAASCAALTVYDMLKAFDKAMLIGPTLLVEKTGGRGGDYRRP